MIFQRSTRGASVAAMLVLASTLMAQEAKQPAPTAQAAAPATATVGGDPSKLPEFVTSEFGPSFKVTPLKPHSMQGRSAAAVTPITFLTGDLDGDGDEDVIIIGRSTSVLVDAQTFGYKVIDPYNAYFGMGNTSITSQFSTANHDQEYMLLIVHGWKLPTPKAKFVVINLPFDKLSITRAMLNKKSRSVLTATESGIMSSTIYWDVKKKRYKYEPGTGESED